jgi:hypothetical protein
MCSADISCGAALLIRRWKQAALRQGFSASVLKFGHSRLRTPQQFLAAM